MRKGLYLLNANAYAMIYGAKERAQIKQWVEICAPPQTPEAMAAGD
jgi:hypothetical protein